MNISEIKEASSEDLVLKFQELSEAYTGQRIPGRERAVRDMIWAEIQERYLPLLRKWIKRVSSLVENSSTLSNEDNRQEAITALVEAMHSYKFHENATFGTWASIIVRGAVLRHSRENSHAISLLKSTKASQVAKFIKDNRKLDFDELAELAVDKFPISTFDFTLIYTSITKSAASNTVAIDNSDSEDSKPADQLVADEKTSGETQLQACQLRTQLKESITSYFDAYDPMYLELFKKRHGLDDNFELTKDTASYEELQRDLESSDIKICLSTVRNLMIRTNANIAKKLQEDLKLEDPGALRYVFQDFLS